MPSCLISDVDVRDKQEEDSWFIPKVLPPNLLVSVGKLSDES